MLITSLINALLENVCMHSYPLPVGEVHDIEELSEFCFLSHLSHRAEREEGDPVRPCKRVNTAQHMHGALIRRSHCP